MGPFSSRKRFLGDEREKARSRTIGFQSRTIGELVKRANDADARLERLIKGVTEALKGGAKYRRGSIARLFNPGLVFRK